ncbi:hypothetical protein [Vibrio nereis]|nr:hypothetical protein [Vibrio nereis]
MSEHLFGKNKHKMAVFNCDEYKDKTNWHLKEWSDMNPLISADLYIGGNA